MQILHLPAPPTLPQAPSPAGAVESSRFTLHRVEVLDADAVAALDPLLANGTILRLVSALTEPATVHVSGEAAFTLSPTDAGQASADPSLTVFETIVDELGVADAGETTSQWDDPGCAAMREVLKALSSSAVAAWRGEPEVIRREAETIGRSFGVSAETIAKLTGRPLSSTKRLVAPMRDAARLEAQVQREAEEKAKRDAAKAAVEAEAKRPKTLRELGLHCIEVRTDRADRGMPSLLNLAISWRSESGGSLFFAWKAVRAFAPPHPLDLDGLRVLDDEEIAPPYCIPSRFVPGDSMRFLTELRNTYGTPDRGPVGRFESSGLSLAREIIGETPGIFRGVNPSTGWQRQHLVELLVRALRIRPDVASSLLFSRTQELHAESYPDVDVPNNRPLIEGGVMHHLPGNLGRGPTAYATVKHKREIPPLPFGAWGRDAIERACVAAAAGGNVSPGELLGERAPSTRPTTNHKHPNKKASAQAAAE